VRWRVRQLLEDRGITMYAFSQMLGYSKPSSAYRRFPEDGRFELVSQTLLNKVCTLLKAPVGDVLEWVPDDVSHSPVRGRRKGKAGT
jgi:DNA-binding Xre family transcriptional regulator